MPPDPKTVDLSDIARLIAGGEDFPWLHKYLADEAVSLWLSLQVDKKTPTRKEVKNRLEGVARAAHLLVRELNDGDMVDFLGLGGLQRNKNTGRFQHKLVALAECAEHAALSSELATPKGKARPGRGRAMLSDGFSSHVFCAVIIAEAWEFIHGSYPPPRNGPAQEAAALFWAQCGGKSTGHSGDKRMSWRPHLERAVKANVPGRLVDFRAEVRRYLTEAVHRAPPGKNPTENTPI